MLAAAVSCRQGLTPDEVLVQERMLCTVLSQGTPGAEQESQWPGREPKEGAATHMSQEGSCLKATRVVCPEMVFPAEKANCHKSHCCKRTPVASGACVSPFYSQLMEPAWKEHLLNNDDNKYGNGYLRSPSGQEKPTSRMFTNNGSNRRKTKRNRY